VDLVEIECRMIHEVITSEKVPFSYRVAGLGSRLLAWLVDLGLIVVLSVMGLLIGSVLEQGRLGLGGAIFMLWTFVVQWGYFLLFEWMWHGQTPGKRLVSIRVVTWQGTGLGFGQAAMRNILRVADGLPLLLMDVVPPLLYGVGFLTAACNRENRRLGDLAAGTLVVYVEHRPGLVGKLLERGGEAAPVRVTLVRQRLERLDRKQKETLLDLCLRRDQQRVRERARLFGAAASYFTDSLDLAPEEYESDEKFIVQLAAVLSSEGPVERISIRS
jgi:uncharacterized RDD family membrane protein YckC